MAFAFPPNLWLARWVVGVGREVRRLAGANVPVPLPWVGPNFGNVMRAQ
jgi:hypothetical protein